MLGGPPPLGGDPVRHEHGQAAGRAAAVHADADADADADAGAKVVGSAVVGPGVAGATDADADADMATAYDLYNAAFPGRMSQGQFSTMSHDRRALAEVRSRDAWVAAHTTTRPPTP